MPVKWTPDKDQLLLLKILETHDLSVDTKKVAAAWPPEDEKNKPTPRAITERLVRMRQMAKASGGGAGTFTIHKGTGGSGSSNPSTPNKQRGKNVVSPSSERKHAALKDEPVDDGDVHVPVSRPSSVKNESAMALKREVDDLIDYESTPTKRSRRASSRPVGMTSWEDGEDDSERESSASEFLPDGYIKEEV